MLTHCQLFILKEVDLLRYYLKLPDIRGSRINTTVKSYQQILDLLTDVYLHSLLNHVSLDPPSHKLKTKYILEGQASALLMVLSDDPVIGAQISQSCFDKALAQFHQLDLAISQQHNPS